MTRLYSSQHHSWCRLILTTKRGARVQIGLSYYALGHIGDVTHIEPSSQLFQPVRVNDNLFRVSWEGFTRTDSDELYHAVWDSIEGIHSIRSPLSGRVVSFNLDKELDDETVLAELECEPVSFANETRVLLDESAYQRFSTGLMAGKFAEEN